MVCGCHVINFHRNCPHRCGRDAYVSFLARPNPQLTVNDTHTTGMLILLLWYITFRFLPFDTSLSSKYKAAEHLNLNGDFASMGLYYQQQLKRTKGNSVYMCENCHAHIFQSCQIVSDSFTGITGQGLLVSRAVNLDEGSIEKRRLRTGTYLVKDVRCVQCHEYLGWKYISSSEEAEKYKEQMLVMEASQLHLSI